MTGAYTRGAEVATCADEASPTGLGGYRSDADYGKISLWWEYIERLRGGHADAPTDFPTFNRYPATSASPCTAVSISDTPSDT